ncbi:MAG: hypothetical protein ACREEK_17250 [Bradyrhizobium sp.]
MKRISREDWPAWHVAVETPKAILPRYCFEFFEHRAYWGTGMKTNHGIAVSPEPLMEHAELFREAGSNFSIEAIPAFEFKSENKSLLVADVHTVGAALLRAKWDGSKGLSNYLRSKMMFSVDPDEKWPPDNFSYRQWCSRHNDAHKLHWRSIDAKPKVAESHIFDQLAQLRAFFNIGG